MSDDYSELYNLAAEIDRLKARLAEEVRAAEFWEKTCKEAEDKLAEALASEERTQRLWDESERKLAEAARFIAEVLDESAEDWRTTKYVVVQMTEQTWDKLKAWPPADSAPGEKP